MVEYLLVLWTTILFKYSDVETRQRLFNVTTELSFHFILSLLSSDIIPNLSESPEEVDKQQKQNTNSYIFSYIVQKEGLKYIVHNKKSVGNRSNSQITVLRNKEGVQIEATHAKE